jgi:NAD(P)H-hydrate epimerase
MTPSKERVSAAEMKAIELNCEYLGISSLQLMECAGQAVALEIASRFKPGSQIVVYSGPGKNGGDGMVAARHLASLGYDVSLVLVGRAEDIKEEIVAENWCTATEMHRSLQVEVISDSSVLAHRDCDVVVDALLGTGARGAPRPPILQAIRTINESKSFKVSIDIPTGVDADSGTTHGDAVKADLTVTFHKEKLGLSKARKYVGELKVASVGMPPEAELLTGPGDVSLVVKKRPPESHKGDFGRLLVVGGSETYTGAPAYVALAALRTGVDLAYIAAPEKSAAVVASFSPNLIAIKLRGSHLSQDNLEEIEPWLSRVTGVVLGPGLGTNSDTAAAVASLLDRVERLQLPLLLDADALKAYGQRRRRIETSAVLTPHFGEFEAVSGKKPSAELESRVKDVQALAQEIHCTVLLKSHIDVISDWKQWRLNMTGNPGMTVGGTGDVLSGIVGALISQGHDPFLASCAGAFVNGAAGDFVSAEKGHHMVATDLIEKIPMVMNDPLSHRSVRSTANHKGKKTFGRVTASPMHF